MASDAVLNPAIDVAESESWLPMIAIAVGQPLMSFNAASLLVAIGGMVHSFTIGCSLSCSEPRRSLRIQGKMARRLRRRREAYCRKY
jgi:hypothetical protein